MKVVMTKVPQDSKFKAGGTYDIKGAELDVLADAGHEYVTAAEQAAKQESELVKASQRAASIQRIKDAVVRAQERKAIAPKDETVQAKALERFEKGADADFVVEFIDGLRPIGDDGLARRMTQPSRDDGVKASRVEVTGISLEDAAQGVVKATAPQNNLIKSGNFRDALALSREAASIMDQNMMKVVRGGGDFMLRDLVRAATFTDPDSQVGSLAGDLILMRNLGYLVNKLAWMKYLTTDLSGEPVQFGQTVLTRYITPPDVLTWVPGVGFTSDATTIAAGGTGTTQSGGTEQGLAGTPAAAGNLYLTPIRSVPSATDKSVTLNMFKATEVQFTVSKLAGTVRNLFAEQLGAQTYSLAETINKYVMAAMFAATWSGTIASFTKSLANWNISSLIDLKTALTVGKVPDVGRFVLLHSFYHDRLLQDTNLLTAKAIMAVIKGDASSFETAEVPAMFGVKPLESQLASATSAGALTTWTDPNTLGTTAMVGFAGNMSSMLFVSRPPQDFTSICNQLNIPLTASIRLVTEPDSGLTVMVFSYADNGSMSIRQRVCLMYGAAQGDPRIGCIIKPA